RTSRTVSWLCPVELLAQDDAVTVQPDGENARWCLWPGAEYGVGILALRSPTLGRTRSRWQRVRSGRIRALEGRYFIPAVERRATLSRNYYHHLDCGCDGGSRSLRPAATYWPSTSSNGLSTRRNRQYCAVARTS